ncbi:hypothetical protein ACE38W_09060 [Chitinophaga sp. Hz27]|uniref:hypothetical protein n=1 Tax=Chitinophaga sp. Hz27 TaxID=3347169 RepID=UPI0035DE0283
MRYLPLYFLGVVLAVCSVVGCRKDAALNSDLQQLSAKAALVDSTGHPKDTLGHDTIPGHHPGDTTHPHPGDTVRPHPGDTVIVWPPRDTVRPPKDTVIVWPPRDTVRPPKDTIRPPKDTTRNRGRS